MRRLCLPVFFLCLACTLSAQKTADTPTDVQPGAADASSRLPVKRVVLYKNGVGYFEHTARVHGTQDLSIAVLVENDTELALNLGADGLHLGDAEESNYGQARNRLGNAAILGVNCGNNRHAAMTLAEMGADYIAFGGPPLESERRAELIAWWGEIFQVPCVALDVEDADQAARLDADFIVPSAKLWLAEDPASKLSQIAASIAQARSAA